MNNLLSEYHVWSTTKGCYAVVDTFYQEVLSIHIDRDEAFGTIRELRSRQRGTYPSIIEA
jgi:hypothetical protein